MEMKTTIEKVPESPVEWRAAKRWNPFNSYKLLAHVERWRKICRGAFLPPPVLITVDPANACNFDCAWCNAKYIREHRNFMLTPKALNEIADFLPHWGENSGYPEPPEGGWGVKAICVAGGGEPLLNKATPAFIERVSANGVEVGVVTNGSMIGDCIEALSQCTWVGVSVDAGSARTLDKLKGLNPSRGEFDRIIGNAATEEVTPLWSFFATLQIVNQIDEVWGREKHWAIHDAINVGSCPRCTYQPHNQIYEQVIMRDGMTLKFI
ncbi:hypothetical protein AGMMS50276_12560 [Synergistales bacterium]|nr:hypothetical protein AGMMS50276_12560 [Synergistales bacterium]